MHTEFFSGGEGIDGGPYVRKTFANIPYTDALTSNVNHQFSDEVVKVVVFASIFDPSLLREDESSLSK